jgi:hypothetical protein
MSVYRYAGIWDNETTYYVNNIVVSNNLAYVAKETVTGGGEPSTNLTQWTYLPAGQQTAATFPVIDGNVSLSVNGTSDLVITAGSSNVQVTSPLLVSGLFNNAGNDPPPNSGDVLKWSGQHIEWETPTATSSVFPVQSSDSNISLSVSGSNLNITNSNAGGNISLSTEGNTYVQIGSQSSAIRLGDLNPSSPDLPSIVLNDAATTINGTNMANNVSIWNPVGGTYIGAASNVNITNGSLLVNKLNNASNSPAPTNGQVLTWSGVDASAKITWATLAGQNSTYFKQDAGSLTWSTVGSYFYTKFAVPAYGTTTVTSNAAPQVTLGAANSSNAPTSGDADNWINCWIANSYAFNDAANSNAYSLYVTAAANPTGLSNVLMNVFIPSP